MSASEFDLLSPPSDGITSLSFAHKSDDLLVSCWDRSTGVILYDTKTRNRKLTFQHSAAVLDACWSPQDEMAFSGCIDGSVNSLNLTTGAVTQIGSHSSGVKCVAYSSHLNLLISGGWDGVLSTWDPRVTSSSSFSSSSFRPIHSFPLPLPPSRSSSSSSSSSSSTPKIYSLSLSSTHLIVSTSSRHLFLYDLRDLSRPQQIRESSLAHQTRCVRMTKEGNGYAVSSIEGRIGIEYFDSLPSYSSSSSSSSSSSNYAFKCHRLPHSDGVSSVLYPVNALCFHPLQGTLVSGGSDGIVNIWDVGNKKRICQYNSYKNSIACVGFNRTGNLLAIGVSDMEEQGEVIEKGKEKMERIVIRKVNENEVRPKVRNTTLTK